MKWKNTKEDGMQGIHKLLIWYGKSWGILMVIAIVAFGTSPEGDTALQGIYALLFLSGILLLFKNRPPFQFGLLENLDVWYGRVWMVTYFIGIIPAILGEWTITLLSLATIPLFAWILITQTLNWSISIRRWHTDRRMRSQIVQATTEYVQP